MHLKLLAWQYLPLLTKKGQLVDTKKGNSFFSKIFKQQAMGGSNHDMILYGSIFLVAFVIFIFVFKNASSRIADKRAKKAYNENTRLAKKRAKEALNEDDDDDDDYWRE